MKILFIFPEIEDPEFRGIQRITTNLLQALYDQKHEIDLLIGLPQLDNPQLGKYLSENLNDVAIKYYFQIGSEMSNIFSKKTKVLLVLKAFLSKKSSTRKKIKRSFCEKGKFTQYLHGFVSIPFIYHLIRKNCLLVYNPLINLAVKKNKYDLVITGKPIDVKLKGKAKLVQVILDMIPFESTHLVFNSDIFKLAKTTYNAIKNADTIFTISNDVKDKILKIKSTARVQVIYGFPQFLNGKAKLSRMNESLTLKGFGLKKNKYLFYVGALEKRKNIKNIVTAYRSAKINGNLVLAGSQGYGFEEIKTAITNSPKEMKKKIILLGYISDYEKMILIKNAKALIFIPHSEGLGLQILEAMALSCPVLASDIPTIREVGGTTISYVKDPNDLAEIAKQLRYVYTNQSKINKLKVLAKKRIANWSYEKFVERVKTGVKLARQS